MNKTLSLLALATALAFATATPGHAASASDKAEPSASARAMVEMSASASKDDGKDRDNGKDKGNDTPAPAPTPTPLPPTKGTPPQVAACTLGDLTGAQACSGFFAGNLNNNQKENIQFQQAALSAIGFDWNGDFSRIEKIEKFNDFSIDFSTLLVGSSFVSVHWGAGKDGPFKTPGGTTAFYRIDAGKGLDEVFSSYGALSNAILYATKLADNGGGGGGGGGGNSSSSNGGGGDVGGTLGAVPEPAVWLQLITGFGLAGCVVRRRRRPAVVA